MKRFLSICLIVVIGLTFVGMTIINVTVPNIVVGSTQLETSIQNTIDNVVHIRNNTGGWQGSGILVAPDLILTARHVAEGGLDFDIMTNDGKVYKATTAISSKKYDLGFIKLDVKLPCTTKLGSIKDCRKGESVYAIGSPFGDVNFNSVTLGIISRLNCDFEKFPQEISSDYGWPTDTFQTDCPAYPGNSGCPLFTTDGLVVGIIVGGFDDNLVYAIPVELIISDLDEIQLLFTMDLYEKEEVKESQENDSYTSKGNY